MDVLVFIISAASQTPGMISQGEQVLQPRRVSYGPVQTLDPLLALLECCKVASVEMRQINEILKQNISLQLQALGTKKKTKQES